MAFGDLPLLFSGFFGGLPIQGIGQGNSADLQIWAALSSPFFNLSD